MSIVSLPTNGKGEQPARAAASSWIRELEAERTEHGKLQAAAHADAAGKQATAGRKPLVISVLEMTTVL